MTNDFVTAADLQVSLGLPEWKAKRIIGIANRKIKESGGMIAKRGMAPRQMIENLLFVDLAPSEDARQACEKASGRPWTVEDEYLIEKRGQGRF